MPNIIFLAFADEQQNSLPALQDEFESLRDLLRPLDAREYIKLVAHGASTREQFIETLNHYQGQLSIVHFSGHASGQEVALADGAAFAKGLAKLLGQEPQLKLLILNGCATRGQVEQALAAGIPLVIATSRPVADEQASCFSIAFYRALVNKRTILEAFNFALGELEARFKQTPELALRGLALRQADESSEALPWGLYTLAGTTPEALHWRLPYYRDSGLSDQLKQDISQRVSTNQYIVQVLDRMCAVNKDITANYLIRYVDGKPQPVDPSSYLDAVIQNFPWVIGSQIGLLRQKLPANLERLEQLLSTYVLSAQLLFYIQLADCWEQKNRKHWPIDVPPGFAQLPRSAEELKQTNFLARLLDLYHWMCRPELPDNRTFFAPELADFCQHLADPGHRLHKAQQALEQLRQKHAARDLGDLNAACKLAEQTLAIVLGEMSFLAAYHFLTVRNIFLDFTLTKPLEYDLEMGKLNTLTASSLGMYQDANYRRKNNYTNSKSIVLTANERDLQFALPLTPFLIDANTYLGDPLPNLFLFAFVEGEKYHYYSVNHDFYTAIAGGKGFDLIHTSLCKEDFLEGTNDSSLEAEEDWLDDGGFAPLGTAISSKTPVFTILEEQLARFRSDFSPYHNPRS